MSKAKFFEWAGVLTAVVYSYVLASNTGNEVLGFALLLASAIFLAIWAWMVNQRGMILILQFFYAISAIIGIIRWF